MSNEQLKFNFNKPVNEKLILSLYDYTTAWVKPYIANGYPVIVWDYKVEGDILSEKFWNAVMPYAEYVYGILSAPPCTDFAGSGARWWKQKDKDTEMISVSCALVEWVLHIKDFFKNLKFWVLENPVGRIEKLIPELKPYRKMSFHPFEYAGNICNPEDESYTKKTILWGNFNEPVKNPVECLYKPHGSSPNAWYNKVGGKSEAAKAHRSKTPIGFANAFYKANR